MPHGNRRNQGRDLTAFRPYRLLDFLEQMHVSQSWLSTDDLPHERAKDQDVKQAHCQGAPFRRMVGGKLLHDLGIADKSPHLPNAIGYRAKTEYVLASVHFQKIPGMPRAFLTATHFLHLKMP